MPKAKAPASLDSTLASILARAVTEIAAAVRQNVADEVIRAFGGSLPSSKPGLGRPPKAVAAKPAGAKPSGAKPAGAKPAGAKIDGRSKPHPQRLYSEADIEKVLSAISARPGMRSPEVRAAAGLDKKIVEKVIGKLRDTGKIKIKGLRSAATYSAA